MTTHRSRRPSASAAVATALAALCALSPSAATLAGNTPGFVLFSDSELQEWRGYSPGADTDAAHSKGMGPAPLTDCHSSPPAPAAASPHINIVQPSLSAPLSSPIDISVDFLPAGGAAIKPDTFKVCYVLPVFTKDITDRIAGHATVSADGIRVKGAELPSGRHHLVLLIADDQGHTGRLDASFEIK